MKKKRRIFYYMQIFSILAALSLSAFSTPVPTQAAMATSVATELPQGDSREWPMGEAQTVSAPITRVIPGGDAVALRLCSDGVLIIGFTDESRSNPARKAGLKEGDRIVGIGESTVSSVDTLLAALNLTQGKQVTLRYVRGKKEQTAKITPTRDKNGDYQLGILVRDSTAGIGTLTFVLPESGQYGCLGHGISDPDTEELFALGRGDLYPAKITAVRKGESGNPGELQGMFDGTCVGNATKNTQCGLFGCMDPHCLSQRETVEIGKKSEIREGKATIRCTLDDGKIGEYEIEIVRIYRAISGPTKNMVLRVTDPTLLAKTGGIVQGMSGSPIFQNGKLVGAVTHVLINDPTCGYGIFIENMLNAAEMPMAKAS